MDIVKVDGFDNLARDKKTGAIVNINSNEMQAARARKEARQAAKEKQAALDNKVNEIDQRVQGIENKIDQIYQLLSAQLTEKK